VGPADRGRVARAVSGLALLLCGGATCRPVGPREVTDEPAPRSTAALDRLREPDAARVVTAQRHDNGSRLVLVNERGLRMRDLTPITEDKAIDSGPTWSRDGAWIAFASSRGRAPAETSIWIVGAEGEAAPVRLTDDQAIDSTPAFSPDGKRIAFASNRGGSFHVWVVDVAGGRAVGAPRQITDGTESEIGPSWLPDGRLLYTATDRVKSWIEISEADGAGARPLTNGPDDRWASASPDGKTIVLSARAPEEARTDLDLWLVDVDGANRRRLADSSLGDEILARFSADGAWVFATSMARTDRGDAIWSSVVFAPADGDGVLRTLVDTAPVPRAGVDLAPVPLDGAALGEAPGYRDALRAVIPGALD
jgi:Tol biopolymer transport system component